MSKPAVDKRKLKDSVAEYLKKGKLDKAVEALEQLVLAEPKDVTNKLKLGECYRKLDRPDKAVICFQTAAKAYSDQGHLSKGIAALKVILEIDPRNAEARRELREIHERRFGRPMEAGGRPSGKTARSAARNDDLEDRSIASIDEAFDEVMGGEGRPLDNEDPSGPITDELEPVSRPLRPESRSLQVSGGLEFTAEDLGDSSEPEEPKPIARLGLKKSTVAQRPARRSAAPLELDPGVQDLPDEAILADDAEDLAAAPDDDEVLELEPELARAAGARTARRRELDLDIPAEPEDEDLGLGSGRRSLDLDLGAPEPKPAAKAMAAKPRPAAKAPSPKALEREIEIAIEAEKPARNAAPGVKNEIANLLEPEGEEEIELFSVGLEEPRPAPGGVTAEIAEAVNALAAKSRRKVPSIRVPLFNDLAPSAFIELVNKLSYRRYGAGQQILHEGDPGRSFFVIAEGKVRVWKKIDGKELTLAQLEEGAFFGEMALLSGAPRTANVSALDETELLEVTDGVLRDVAQKHPAVIQSLKNFYRQRLLSNAMTISPIFRDFSPADRKHIVAKFKLRQSAPGEVLIKEGKQSDGLYVVLHGTAEVSSHNVVLAQLKEGEIFGEMSLLTRDPAAATVTSPGNALLLRLGRAQFQELVATHPQILALVSYLNEQRAAANRAALKKHGILS